MTSPQSGDDHQLQLFHNLISPYAISFLDRQLSFPTEFENKRAKKRKSQKASDLNRTAQRAGRENLLKVLIQSTRGLGWLNARILTVGRYLSIVCMGLMVLSILMQVFFRYVLADALPWSEEAARFFMLWMAGLSAPAAYRAGGFVAIDTLPLMLGRIAAALLNLALLLVATIVLYWAIKLGYKHVNSGWLFNSSSLKLPMDWFEMRPLRMKLAWMYMSLFTGVILLFAVNIELVLRNLVDLLGAREKLTSDPTLGFAGAE